MMTRKVEGGGGIVFVLLLVEEEEEEEVGPTLPWPHLPTVPTMRNYCSPAMSPCHLNQGLLLLLLLLLLRCNRNNNTNHIIVGIIFHIDSREVVLVIVLLEKIHIAVDKTKSPFVAIHPLPPNHDASPIIICTYMI